MSDHLCSKFGKHIPISPFLAIFLKNSPQLDFSLRKGGPVVIDLEAAIIDVIF